LGHNCSAVSGRFRAAETVHGFCDAISKMEKTSEKRKEFLRSRYSYWVSYGKIENKGGFRSLEAE
jgi:hypothetical protein